MQKVQRRLHKALAQKSKQKLFTKYQKKWSEAVDEKFIFVERKVCRLMYMQRLVWLYSLADARCCANVLVCGVPSPHLFNFAHRLSVFGANSFHISRVHVYAFFFI